MRMLSGEPVIPEKHWDMAVRLEICRDFMNRRRYEEASDGVKALFQAYLDTVTAYHLDRQPTVHNPQEPPALPPGQPAPIPFEQAQQQFGVQ